MKGRFLTVMSSKLGRRRMLQIPLIMKSSDPCSFFLASGVKRSNALWSTIFSIGKPFLCCHSAWCNFSTPNRSSMYLRKHSCLRVGQKAFSYSKGGKAYTAINLSRPSLMFKTLHCLHLIFYDSKMGYLAISVGRSTLFLSRSKD